MRELARRSISAYRTARSFTSETSPAYGSFVLRQGRSLAFRPNQARSSGSTPTTLNGPIATIAPLAYDETLAGRIRELVAGESGLTEKKMFGGLAFMIGGNMAVAASGQGGLLVRVDPEASDSLVATTTARLMEMRGRAMRGWLRVDSGDLRTKAQLVKWVELGTAYARSLPAK